jgi:hypothetical protein
MIIWPDGSQGRFYPLRGPWIKNPQIRTNVYNRVTAHVKAKQECVTIETPLLDADSTERFNDMTIMEAVLSQTASIDGESIRVFQHIKKVWSRDKVQKWGVAVRPQFARSAAMIIDNLKSNITNTCGSEFEKFFNSTTTTRSRTPSALDNDDDLDWFKDDENETLEEIGKSVGVIFTESLESFMNETPPSHLPQDFGEDKSIDNTVGSMGSTIGTSDDQRWKLVQKKRNRKKKPQDDRSSSGSSSSSAPSSNSGTSSSVILTYTAPHITWCDNMTQWKQFLPAIKLRSMEVHKLLCHDSRFGRITADTIMHGNVLPSVLKQLETNLTILADYPGPDMAANRIASAYCGKNIDLQVTFGGTVSPLYP